MTPDRHVAALEVIATLAETRTPFQCLCGGWLWLRAAYDENEQDRIVCDQCSQSMRMHLDA